MILTKNLSLKQFPMHFEKGTIQTKSIIACLFLEYLCLFLIFLSSRRHALPLLQKIRQIKKVRIGSTKSQKKLLMLNKINLRNYKIIYQKKCKFLILLYLLFKFITCFQLNYIDLNYLGEVIFADFLFFVEILNPTCLK